MNYRKMFSRSGTFGFVLAAAALMMVSGCLVYGPRAGYVEGPTVFVEQDDYIYYPSYGVYYSNSRHQYAYQERGRWVGRPAPRGVTVDVLLASPSVRMDFHDSPANHHSAIVQQYPRNWAPSHPDQRPPERSGGDQHNERGNDNHDQGRGRGGR